MARISIRGDSSPAVSDPMLLALGLLPFLSDRELSGRTWLALVTLRAATNSWPVHACLDFRLVISRL